MNKRGMSLITLLIVTLVLLIVFAVTLMTIVKTTVIQGLENTSENMDLLNFQQLANIAYASVYFENLHNGIRRELTVEEVRTRMIKNGTDEIELEKYEISIENGDVFITVKEEE